MATEIKPAILKGCDGGSGDVIINYSPFDVGRSKTAKLIITDVNISRNHCQMVYNENKKWLLQDTSSSGTYVNEILIGKGNSVDLNNGDIVRFGPIESNLIWRFYSSKDAVAENEDDKMIIDDIEAQSQAIQDFCTEKSKLEERMIVNREFYVQMKKERDRLQKECEDKIKSMEMKYSVEREQLQNHSAEIKQDMEQRAEEEKKRIYSEVEEQMKTLQEKLAENYQIEKELKSEIQSLQEKIEIEKSQWETSFLEEKRKLEEKINQQQRQFDCEKMRVEENAQKHEKELEDKLIREEAEKRLLLTKLREMEAAHKLLTEKLKAEEESRMLDKAKLEENMLELNEKEQKLKEQVDSLKKAKEDIETNLKAELEKKESEKTQDLLRELQRVKKALSQTENKKESLEKELAEASSAKDEASKIKSNLLANFTDVMESELTCSICSELFVTAMTLNCTHSFCKYCINEWKKKKKNCPICRKKITSENRSIVMDNYIDKMVESLSPELKERRESIIAERNGVPHKKPKLRNSVGSCNAFGGSGPSSSAPQRPTSAQTSNSSATVRINPVPIVDLTVSQDTLESAPPNVVRLQRLPAVRGPIPVRPNRITTIPGDIQDGRATLLSLPNWRPQTFIVNPGGTAPAQTGTVDLTGIDQSTSNSTSENSEEVDRDDDDDRSRSSRSSYDYDDDDRSHLDDDDVISRSSYDDYNDDNDNKSHRSYNNHSDSYTESNSDTEDYDPGVPGEYYGGYGRCFICQRRGHWANGCPERRSRYRRQ